MKRTGMKSFIAAVTDDHSDRMEEVADRLREKGCKINQILKLTGIITGRVSLSTPLNDLIIKGIKSVEIEKKLRKI